MHFWVLSLFLWPEITFSDGFHGLCRIKPEIHTFFGNKELFRTFGKRFWGVKISPGSLGRARKPNILRRKRIKIALE